jgi:hypothetical protein
MKKILLPLLVVSIFVSACASSSIRTPAAITTTPFRETSTAVLASPTRPELTGAPDLVALATNQSREEITTLAKTQGVTSIQVVRLWNRKTGPESKVYSYLESTTDKTQAWYVSHDQILSPSEHEVASLKPVPLLPALARTFLVTDHGEFIFSYRNATGDEIATLNPFDKYHNRQIAWNWKYALASAEKTQVIQQMFDAQYLNFASGYDAPESKAWIASALSKWALQVSGLALPNVPAIREHYPSSDPPSPENMFEALSRIKLLSTSGTSTSYGGFDGEVKFSAASSFDYPAEYNRVATPEEMSLFTFAIAVKEASVIRWAQEHDLKSGCSPNAVDNQVEYYSTTWLVMVLQELGPKLSGDKSWILNTTLPFYEDVLRTGHFPPCG